MSNISHALTISVGDCEVLSTRWSPDDTLLSAANSDGTVQIYDPIGTPINTLLCYQSLRYPVTSVRWRPLTSSKTKNILLATTCDGSIYHFHVSSGKVLHHTPLSTGAQCCDYSAEGSHYAIGCDNGSLLVYDENTKSLVREYGDNTQGMRHCTRILCAKWVSPQVLWTGGWDKNVICWDYRMNCSVRHIYGPKICGEALDFSENRLFTGSYDVEAQLACWDAGSGREIRSVTVGDEGDKCLIYSIQISKAELNKFVAVTGVGRNSAYFYNIDTLSPEGLIDGINKPVYSVDFSNRGHLLAMGGGDGAIRLFSYY